MYNLDLISADCLKKILRIKINVFNVKFNNCLFKRMGKIPFSKDKLIRFNTTEGNSLGKGFSFIVGILSSIDVLVVEAVSSFFKSLRDNSVKAQNCLFVNASISRHSAA